MAPVMSRAPLRRPIPEPTSSLERGRPIRLWETCSNADVLISAIALFMRGGDEDTITITKQCELAEHFALFIYLTAQ